jgi:hypothetical protein
MRQKVSYIRKHSSLLHGKSKKFFEVPTAVKYPSEEAKDVIFSLQSPSFLSALSSIFLLAQNAKKSFPRRRQIS